MARIEMEVDLEDLPYELADQCTATALLKLIMGIDEQVADRWFTETLIKRLRASLEEDDGIH